MTRPRTHGSTAAVAEDISTARCLALHKSGLLVGYVSRGWNYGTLSSGRWGRWRAGPMRRGKRDKGRDISDWDLGNERLIRGGYALIPVDESEAKAMLGPTDHEGRTL